jgi:hypothetical protein
MLTLYLKELFALLMGVPEECREIWTNELKALIRVEI